MSVLDRRRIEAKVLGPVIRAFQQEFGVERTNGVVRRAIVEIARDQGRELAQRSEADDLTAYADAKGPWRAGGALETEELALEADRYDFNVTRCRYAEMYEELGYRDLGALLSCARDFVFGEGFNPEMKLRRTQTIMEGASHCDFRYRTGPASGSPQSDHNVGDQQ